MVPTQHYCLYCRSATSLVSKQHFLEGWLFIGLQCCLYFSLVRKRNGKKGRRRRMLLPFPHYSHPLLSILFKNPFWNLSGFYFLRYPTCCHMGKNAIFDWKVVKCELREKSFTVIGMNEILDLLCAPHVFYLALNPKHVFLCLTPMLFFHIIHGHVLKGCCNSINVVVSL